jgi:hypothetical protein
VSNYLLDLVRRGAGLAPVVAPEASLQPDFGPLFPVDTMPRSVPDTPGVLATDQDLPEAQRHRLPTQSRAMAPAQPPPELEGSSDAETTEPTLSSPDAATTATPHTATPRTPSQPPASQPDPERETQLAGDTPPLESSLDDVPSSPLDVSLEEASPRRSQPPVRHRQSAPPEDDLSSRETAHPRTLSSEAAAPQNPTQGRSSRVASPAEKSRSRAETVRVGGFSPEQRPFELPPAEDAPTVSWGGVAPNPDATIAAQRPVTRASAEPPVPSPRADLTQTEMPAEHEAPEYRATTREEQSRDQARRTDPDAGATDGPDHPLLGARSPGRLDGHPTLQPAGGEPEGARGRSIPPVGEKAARTSAPLVTRSLREQAAYPEPGDEPQDSRDFPARSNAVPRSVESAVAPAVDPLARPTIPAVREEPIASRAEPQTIRVRIGRVEVRAATPSPPAPPTPRAPKPQGFEDYELMRSYLSWERH